LNPEFKIYPFQAFQKGMVGIFFLIAGQLDSGKPLITFAG